VVYNSVKIMQDYRAGAEIYFDGVILAGGNSA